MVLARVDDGICLRQVQPEVGVPGQRHTQAMAAVQGRGVHQDHLGAAQPDPEGQDPPGAWVSSGP